MSHISIKAVTPDLLVVADHAATAFKDAVLIYMNGRSSGIIETKRAIKRNALTALNMFRVQLEDRARNTDSQFARKTFKGAALFLEAFEEYINKQLGNNEDEDTFDEIIEQVGTFLTKARDNIKQAYRKWRNN